MKTTVTKLARAQAGQSILLVLIVSTFTFAILGGLFKWTFSNSSNNLRNNQYFRSSAAAEAATEKVITSLASDYQNDGEALVMTKLNAYRALVPNRNESAVWGKYEFSDGEGNLGQTYVKDLPPAEFKVLNSQYAGLSGYATAFRIISNARDTKSPYNIVSAVRQDIQVATIPIFQFAIFYNLDLEINPGPDMTVTGPVHCNKTTYLDPESTLTFKSD
ncbi:MAG TPA: hypothetical protein VK615_05625, partial [Candidatus Binatia bacterium]|nr:hypothetical protein [Candidatus Binatia bacterium]